MDSEVYAVALLSDELVDYRPAGLWRPTVSAPSVG